MVVDMQSASRPTRRLVSATPHPILHCLAGFVSNLLLVAADHATPTVVIDFSSESTSLHPSTPCTAVVGTVLHFQVVLGRNS